MGWYGCEWCEVDVRVERFRIGEKYCFRAFSCYQSPLVDVILIVEVAAHMRPEDFDLVLFDVIDHVVYETGFVRLSPVVSPIEGGRVSLSPPCLFDGVAIVDALARPWTCGDFGQVENPD